MVTSQKPHTAFHVDSPVYSEIGQVLQAIKGELILRGWFGGGDSAGKRLVVEKCKLGRSRRSRCPDGEVEGDGFR